MDSAKRPLELPPDFAKYAETHKLFEMFKFLQEQLIIKRPENPLEFLIGCLNYKEVTRVLIIGPPNSGKSTLAHMISHYLNLVNMNMDNLIPRASVELQEEALECKESGNSKNNPPPKDLYSKIKFLKGFGKTLLVVFLEAPDTVLIERAVGKRVDRRDGSIYHTAFDWPENPAILKHLVTVPGCSEPEMVARLMEYHIKVDELMKCFPHISKTINADEPKADIFAEALAFLTTSPKSMAPHHPRVILFGATGSGKRTQAKLLAEKYKLINVSCGQLIKVAIEAETKMGLTAKNYIDKQMEIPNVITLAILKERLGRLDCLTYGWVLHGFPKNKRQAEHMGSCGLSPSRVLFLDVPRDTVIERMTGKRTDIVTGQQCHLDFAPSVATEEMSRLYISPKHKPEVVTEEFNVYQRHEEELSEFYREIGIHVNADQNYYTVFEVIESIIAHLVPKKFKMNPLAFHETVRNGSY